MKQITHWIDGKPWVGDAERRGTVFDPATGPPDGEVDFAGDDRGGRGRGRRSAGLRRAGGPRRSAKRTVALFSLRASWPTTSTTWPIW